MPSTNDIALFNLALTDDNDALASACDYIRKTGKILDMYW